jgi:Ca2+-transporting ATPase
LFWLVPHFKLVIIVALISSISNYQKQAQFKKLNDFSKSLSEAKVIRGGIAIQIPSGEVVVGEIMPIETGDILLADGLLINGDYIEVDESTMTGESMGVRKDLSTDPFLISGTKLINGVGRMLVLATGVHSLNGKALLSLEVEHEETPLQSKLRQLADSIAKFAITSAFLFSLLLIGAFFAFGYNDGSVTDISASIVRLIILGITIVVVAVPEGLPLAVTLALAHATIKMVQDNNLVRHLAACETMGNATTICSDKTGTLTLNKMTVVKATIMCLNLEGEQLSPNFITEFAQVNQDWEHLRKVLFLIAKSLYFNTTAAEFLDRNGDMVLKGSKTEIAVLHLIEKLGFKNEDLKKASKLIQMVPFSSSSKRMTIVLELPPDIEMDKKLDIIPCNSNRNWICVKGAPEEILKNCSYVLRPPGRIVPLSKTLEDEIRKMIDGYSERALRTLCAAIKPIGENDAFLAPDGLIADRYDMVLVCLIGIEDPLRPEVPSAIASCKSAGIKVRMVTGDSIGTAKSIGKACGILTEQGIAMEGPEFRNLSPAEMDEILPNLQILARSTPLDKQILVKRLKQLNEVVAVTGGFGF